MKPKAGTVGLIVIMCAGLGLYWLFKVHGLSTEKRKKAVKAPTLVSVHIGTIERMTLHRYVNGYATVAPEPATVSKPAADAPLAPPTSGTVAGINVAEGELVRKGEVLMTLDSSSATAAYAKQEVTRQKQLYAQHNTSLKSLQSAEAQMSLLQVISPLSGTLVNLNVKVGAAVGINTVVAEVMDLKRLVVKTAVPEGEADELRRGEVVRIMTPRPVEARLSFVSPMVDTSNGTVTAWAALPAKSDLRPGRYVRIRIVTATHTNCLTVPAKSVVTEENGKSVIYLVRDSQATRMQVQTGFSENDRVEVRGAGLKEGQTVVTAGAYGLPGKTQIQVVK
ncbi:MAG: efflux RND transporter periplasmic adaptor subunit [Syntrophobacteraceae bacterium]